MLEEIAVNSVGKVSAFVGCIFPKRSNNEVIQMIRLKVTGMRIKVKQGKELKQVMGQKMKVTIRLLEVDGMACAKALRCVSSVPGGHCDCNRENKGEILGAKVRGEMGVAPSWGSLKTLVAPWLRREDTRVSQKWSPGLFLHVLHQPALL